MQHENEPNAVTPEKSLVDYFYLFVEKLWLIIIFLIIGLVFAHREVSNEPIWYQSSAIVEVQGIATNIEDEVGGLSILRPTDFTATTADKLRLDSLYLKVVDSQEFRKHLSKLGGGLSDAQRRDKLAGIIKGSTIIRLRPQIPLIDIYVTHTDPEFTRDVIAVMLRVYEESSTLKRDVETEQTMKILDQEIADSRNKLSEAESSLVTYKRALEIREEVLASEARVLEMEKKYKSKWPDLIQEKEHQRALIEKFITELYRIQDGSDTEYGFWEAAVESKGAMDEDTLLKFKLQTTEARNNMLQRDHKSEEDLFNVLLDRKKGYSSKELYDATEIEILQHPQLPKEPVSYNKTRVYMKYGLLGVAVGMGISFLLGSLDSRIRRIEDLEKISNVKVLSAVPKSHKLSKGLITDDRNNEYESIRTLHTNVLLNAPDAKVTLITSSTPSEGKSTISCNLAAVSASCGWGERVLLIDFDLRKARIHQYMGLADDTKGVGDYLINKDSINECIAKHPEVPDLYVMVGGTVRFEGALPELKDLEEMLELLRGNFDRIIIDSAPILAVSDTLVVSQYVDELILVFRMWKTPRKALIRTLMQLSDNGTYPFGVVANYMPQRGLVGRHSYYYSYAGTGYKDYSAKSKR